MKGRLIVLTVIAVTVFSSARAEEGKPLLENAVKPVRYDSPQAAFDAWRKANTDLDFATFFGTLSKLEQDRQAFEIIFSNYFIDDAKLNQIQAKYYDEKKLKELEKEGKFKDVDEPTRMRLIASCIQEKQKLFVESQQRLLEMKKLEAGKYTDLTDVKVDGMKAQARTTTKYLSKSVLIDEQKKETVTVEERELHLRAYFVIEDGSWRVDPFEPIIEELGLGVEE
jgi:hypothetical protein